MLHFLAKEKPSYCFLLLLLLWVLPSCKRDASAHTEEEDIYLADYDSPVDKWGFIDTLGQLVIKPVFDDVGHFSEGLAAVNMNGRWGYIDQGGKLVINPVFKSAWAFHEGMARVSPFNVPDHFISRSGKLLASPEWSAADDFSGGFAKVKVGNSFGYIDTSGNLVLPAIYSRCWSFKHGLAIISIEEKLGLINSKGEEILSPQFDKIKIDEEANLILCNTATTAFIYDLNGREKFRIAGAKATESDGLLVAIQKGDLFFFLDLADGSLLPGSGWSNLFYLGERRWAGKNASGFFLLNSEGTKIGLKPFAQINRLVDGYAAYYNGSNWGYMDADGRERTPDVFALAWDFKDGFARAAFTEGIAFINRRLELAFYPPPGTIDMRDFAEGLAPVQVANQ